MRNRILWSSIFIILFSLLIVSKIIGHEFSQPAHSEQAFLIQQFRPGQTYRSLHCHKLEIELTPYVQYRNPYPIGCWIYGFTEKIKIIYLKLNESNKIGYVIITSQDIPLSEFVSIYGLPKRFKQRGLDIFASWDTLWVIAEKALFVDQVDIRKIILYR